MTRKPEVSREWRPWVKVAFLPVWCCWRLLCWTSDMEDRHGITWRRIFRREVRKKLDGP